MEQNRIERAPTLGARLQKCADFVREGKKLADIGTDHGYVPVCLLQSGKIPFAVAVDVHKGPLESAMNNASRCGVADKMHFVCGDGLHGVLPDEAEDIGTAEDGAAADTVLLYYQTLLRDRLGSLFECQKLQAYWETTTAYTTVFKTSAEHQLILDAGAYDVSAKLLEENLTVDTGWVQRKNPGMIVKVVGSDILGSGVQSTAAAKAAADELTARDGWAGLDAVKNGKILVLSSDLLTTQARKTAAAVYLSKEMYPSLFEDVDADEALRLLTEEAGGTPLSGIFAYAG